MPSLPAAIYEKYQAVRDKVGTTKGTKVRSKSRTLKQNWMTDELFDLSAKRTRLHNKAKSEPLNEKLQNDYKAFRIMVTNKIAAAKRSTIAISMKIAEEIRMKSGVT